jgi:mono/diheme cytochrome c family protein
VKINILITTLFSLSLISCSGGRNSTGYSIINDMMYSEAYEAYSVNPVFDNGQSMQEAPAGTIPRGYLPEERNSEGKLKIVPNPFSHTMNDYQWKRGKILYERTCSACHGDKGLGNGLVVVDGGFPAPPKFKARKWKKKNSDRTNYAYPSGYIYNVITDGYGNMPSHAQQLYQQDRWFVSEYVREYLMKGGSNYKKTLK